MFDRSGEETDALAGLSLQLLRATDGLFVGNTDGKVVAYDPMTSTTLWSEPGWAITGDGDHLYACQGDQENKSAISQLSLLDGAALWSVSAPCDIVVPLEDSVVIVGFDPKVDGGYTLVVVDESTGDERVRRRFEDGTNDQVTGLIDAYTGQRVWTVGVGIAENVSVTAGGDLVYARTPLSLHALDRATGETVWVRALPWSGDVVTPNADTED